jgi:methylenetetrahydrofolate reductase (NADPH)
MLETASQIEPHSPTLYPSLMGLVEAPVKQPCFAMPNLLKEEHGFEVMPHLTCVGHTRDELLEIFEEFAEAGFRNVMALRGDPPKGESTFNQYRVDCLTGLILLP